LLDSHLETSLINTMTNTATTAAPLRIATSFLPIDHTWSATLDECRVVLSNDDGAECELVVAYSEDTSSRPGRFVTVRLLDCDGDPDGVAWFESAEAQIVDWFDAECAKRGRVWC
jgi:hypothetical protein